MTAHLRANSEGHPTLRSRRRGLIEPPIVSLFRPVGAKRNYLLRHQRNDGAAGGILCRRCLLKWKIHDPCLFQVEFAFHAPARFIGDLALLQQPVDVFALSGDQFRP